MLCNSTTTSYNSSYSHPNMHLLISSTTTTNHQWPQNQQIIDEKKHSSSSSNNNNSSSSSLMMASPPILMDKSNPQHQHQDLHQQNQLQQSLKCPRCDSSNTKFCYYNNYSLSQPRHFCKACKRYWTRGGTLRNVPVGGGCRRKNKRTVNKRPPSDSISTLDNSSPNSPSIPNPNSSNALINHHHPPLFYGLTTTTTTAADHPTHLNLPFPNFHSRVSASGYDGLGFSSGLMDYENPSGFNPKEIQDVVNSSSLLSRYPIFGSTNLQQQQHQKFMGGLVNYEDMQTMGGGGGSNNDGNMVIKEVKMEDSRNRLNWNSTSASTQMDQIGSSDPSILWGSNSVGSWLDPSNIGSSVPSLI